jgi:hypothetical protein
LAGSKRQVRRADRFQQRHAVLILPWGDRPAQLASVSSTALATLWFYLGSQLTPWTAEINVVLRWDDEL